MIANGTVSFDPAVNMARQALYRFAAVSLVDPQTGSWGQLHSMREDGLLPEAAGLIRGWPQARPGKLGAGERSVRYLDPAPVLERLPASQEALNEEYENAFGLVVFSGCPPYETEYIDGKFAFQRSGAMADICGFYRAFGLAIADRHPERPDHVVLELEFMASLLALERQAYDGNSELRPERLNVCRDAQVRFVKEHLAWWAPPFAKLLAHANRDGFYAAAGTFLAALIPAERALLKVDVQARSISPSPQEQPEDCEGCQLAK